MTNFKVSITHFNFNRLKKICLCCK